MLNILYYACPPKLETLITYKILPVYDYVYEIENRDTKNLNVSKTIEIVSMGSEKSLCIKYIHTLYKTWVMSDFKF